MSIDYGTGIEKLQHAVPMMIALAIFVVFFISTLGLASGTKSGTRRFLVICASVGLSFGAYLLVIELLKGTFLDIAL